jgi:hypothetical protein
MGDPKIQLPAIVIHKYVYWIWARERQDQR